MKKDAATARTYTDLGLNILLNFQQLYYASFPSKLSLKLKKLMATKKSKKLRLVVISQVVVYFKVDSINRGG